MKALVLLGALTASVSFAQADPQTVIGEGAVIYSTHCLSCHQVMGQGIEGAFPGFVDNPFVLGDPAAVALLPLNGRGGMPSFSGELSDEEIAAVLSYIRNSWGNKASLVTPDIVARARSGETEAAPTDPNARPGASN